MNKRLAGLILMILGASISLFLLAWSAQSGYLHWKTMDSFKVEEFPTIWAYYWGRETSSFLYALVCGAIPFYIGIRLRKKIPNSAAVDTPES